MGKVVVLGGGIAGLTAAHELIERGFEVDVYEANATLGGKARSQWVAGSAAGGRRELPGEHGFRFYPRFYEHVIDTMRRIPLVGQPGANVRDNLRDCNEAAVALADGCCLHRFARRAPNTPLSIARSIELFFQTMDVDSFDVGLFIMKVLQYLTSCEERRAGEYEGVSWWSYLRGDGYSANFQRFLRIVPRTMVAMDPMRGSARSIGNISMQLLLDFSHEGVNTDRTMSGPTSEMWLEHWVAYLASRGVRFHLSAPVTSLMFERDRITGVCIAGESAPIVGDYYVSAIPIDVMHRLITPAMCEAEPSLAAIAHADMSQLTAWMAGIQFFLWEDVQCVPGHVFFADAPWALTLISQAQFWNDHGMFRKRYGNGEVGGILSVDISDWETPGVMVRKPARACTPAEIAREVWGQLKIHLNSLSSICLTDAHLHSWHLDADLDYSLGTPPINRSRLLVHPPGSWAHRPEPDCTIENLFLAGDYVRTNTDLASMEGANEAARRATNAILDRDGFTGAKARVWRLQEPTQLTRFKERDRRRHEAGRPHGFEMLGGPSMFRLAGAMRVVGEAVGLEWLDDHLDRVRVSQVVDTFMRRVGVIA